MFYVHVTVHRNKFLYNKTNQMHQFPKFNPAWNSTCFGQLLCPSSEVQSLYTRHRFKLCHTGLKTAWSCSKAVFKPVWHKWLENKVRELATVCLPWQHCTKALVWFDDVDISVFRSCVVVVDLWQSLYGWHLLLSACVLVCRRENVGAWIRATNEH